MTVGDPFGPPLFEPAPIYIAGSDVPHFLNPYTGRYTRSKSYARRMQSGYQRGLSLSEARGYRTVGGLTESQRRRERTFQATGLTPNQIFQIGFEQRYGFTYNYWRYLKRNWVDDINSRSSPISQITPSVIGEELAWSTETGHNEEWIEHRLYEKLTAMIAYQDYHDPVPGRVDWNRQDSVAINFMEGVASYDPIMWWWYH